MEEKSIDEQLTDNNNRTNFIPKDYFPEILNRLGNAIFVKNRKHEWVYLNDKFCELFGTSRENLLGKSDYDFFPECQAKIFWEKDEKVFKTGKMDVNEELFTTFQGETKTIQTTKTLFTDDKGHKFIIGIIEEITKRKKMEEKLRENEEKFRNVFEQGPMGMALIDIDLKFIEINDRLCKMLGYTREELVNLDFAEITHSEDREKDKQLAMKVFSGNKSFYKIEKRYIKKDGQFLWVKLTATIIKDKEGKPKIGLGMIEDISEKKAAEEKLLQSEAKYKKISQELNIIIDSLPGLIFYKDTQNNFLKVNQYLAETQGLSKEEMEGKSCFDLFPDKLAQKYWEDDKKVIQSKKPTLNIEEKWEIKGEIRWVNTSKIPEIDENGRVKGIIGISLDTTEKKIAENKLKNSERKYRELVESANEGIWAIDAEGYTSFVNQQMAEMLGYKPEEMLERSLFEFMDEKTKEKAQELLNRREKEIKARHQFSFKKRDGSTVFTVLSASPKLNQQGKFIGAIAYISNITERIKAEQKLKQSEQKYRVLFEEAPFSIILFNNDGTIYDCNREMENLFGYKKNELIGLHFRELDLYKNQKFLIENLYDSLLERSSTDPIELNYTKKDGSNISVLANFSVIHMGSEDHIQGILYDITQRKVALQKLEDSERRYRLITENANDFIATLNQNYEFDYVNKNILKNLLGYNLKEFLGKSPTDFIHPDHHEEAFLAIKECSTKGKFHKSFKWIRKDGQTIWLDSKGRSFIGENKELKMLLTSRDITKQKKAEREIIQSNEKYQSVLQNIEEGYFEVDREGTFKFFNNAFSSLMKIPKEILKNKNYGELFSKSNKEEIFQKFNALYLRGEGSIIFEFKYKPPLEDEIFIETSVYLRHDKDNNIVGFKGFCRDVSQRKEMELLRKDFNQTLEDEVVKRTKELNQALEQQKLYLDEIAKSSKFKTEFLATMSHELRTPLNAIIGFTDLLLEGAYGELNEDQLEFMQDIKTSAEHQLDMIEQILDITKIESGQLELSLKEFSINTIVDQVKSNLRPLYKKKGLHFHVIGLEKSKKMYADPIKFKEILLNLLSNAIKFTMDGKITLIIKEDYDNWYFKVRDTGIGIAQEDYDKVFKEFKRVQSTYVESTKGSGLGLSLTKRLVNLHKGDISFTSVLGMGTTFKFSIPKNPSFEEEEY